MKMTHSKHTIQEAIVEQLDALPATMSQGQRALEALSLYRSASLPVPDEVLRQITNCYRHFTQGKPVAGWVAVERNKPAPLTLGEAFGVPDIKGEQKTALKRKRLAMASPQLVALFSGQGVAKVPRTKEGVALAAKKLNLTVGEVQKWVDMYPAGRRAKNPEPYQSFRP
jgi:hypothetical protein